jgi:hypothetical protein
MPKNVTKSFKFIIEIAFSRHKNLKIATLSVISFIYKNERTPFLSLMQNLVLEILF